MPVPRRAKPLVEPGAQIGRAVDRVDGRDKLTGRALYAAEHDVPGLLHGYIVSSAITKGTIRAIDTSAALALPGVVHVLTHENRPRLAWFDRKWKDDDAPKGAPFRPLHDAQISHALQPIALVVANSFEAARAGARLVRVEYEAAAHQTDLAHGARFRPTMTDKLGFSPPPKPRGDADEALAAAMIRVDAAYTQAIEHHQPIELFASTAIYHEDGTLTVYDKTQGVQNTHAYLCKVFGRSETEIRVLAPYVGGAFGSGLRPQHQVVLAVMAATQLARSVRVELSRAQMFSFGHRPETVQRVALGARPDGTLTALIHEAVQGGSHFENYAETVVNWSAQQYKAETSRFDYQIARLDLFTPLDMRAPGAQPGVAAIECAIDELAYALDMDPIALRLHNYTDTDPTSDKPFSSKELRACFTQGAERFGWSRRALRPRAMKQGHALVGYGMAAGVWDAMQVIASARATLRADGTLVAASATGEIGTGSYTVMTQIAADVLGLAIDDVRFELGDSTLPPAPLVGGSWTVSTVGSAVKLACDEVGKRLVELLAKHARGALATATLAEVVFADGHLQLARDRAQRIQLTELMQRAGLTEIVETVQSMPYPQERLNKIFATHSAVFAEVHVDEDLGMVRVARVVSAIAAGRIINPKTARSQIIGAIVGGIGHALYEATLVDHRLGRFVNHDLAEYHLAANADVGELDVIFVDEHDEAVNALGAKGVGEIGIVGVAAAIANAIFHATGRRVREFPITLDKLL